MNYGGVRIKQSPSISAEAEAGAAAGAEAAPAPVRPKRSKRPKRPSLKWHHTMECTDPEEYQPPPKRKR